MRKGLLKKISAVMLAAAVGIGMVSAAGYLTNGKVGEVRAQAATGKQALLKKIEAKSGETVMQSFYTDYDGDGTKEVFAVTQAKQGYGHHIWYAGAKQIRQVKTDNSPCHLDSESQGDTKVVCKVSKKQKLFIMACGNGNDGSSVCYYVSGGKVRTVNQYLEGLEQLSGKQFAIYPSAWDHADFGDGKLGVHTWKRYYLKWTGKKFVEYKGKVISKKKLKSYKNGSSVIKKIQKEGYSIGKIYKRSNGIININVSMKNNEETWYENVTLKLKKGKVTVVKVPDSHSISSGKGIVARSTYGGIYAASSGSLKK